MITVLYIEAARKSIESFLAPNLLVSPSSLKVDVNKSKRETSTFYRAVFYIAERITEKERGQSI